jgi:hypothetical protein
MKKRSEEKQEQLKKEKDRVIKESLKYTNKYNEYKQNLEQIQILREDVQNEITFFDKQIKCSVFYLEAEKVNESLKNDIDHLLQQIRTYEPEFDLDEQQSIWEIYPDTNNSEKQMQSMMQQSLL